MKKIFKKINSKVLKNFAIVISLYFFYMFYIFMNKDEEILGIVMPKNQTFVPLIISGILIILHIFEYFSSKPIGRSIYLGISILICLSSFDSINYLNLLIFYLGLIYFIATIISSFNNNKIKSEVSDNYASSKKVLSAGMFSKKQQVLSNLISVILFFIFIGLIAVNFFFEFMNMIALIIILIILFFISIIIISIFLNPLNTAEFEIKKTCNYHKFIEKINSIEKENLHPDSLSYLLLIKYNYTIAVNLDEANSIFESINRPSHKSYDKMYNIYKISYLINNKDYENATKLIIECKKDYKIYKSVLDDFELIIKINNKEIIPNIKDFYRIDSKIKFNNVCSCNTLMRYYFLQNDLENSKKYAKILLDYNTDFASMNNFANEILEIKE